MERTPFGYLWLGIVMALWMGSGCAKPPLVTPIDPEITPVPAHEWMRRQSGAHQTDAGQVFFGIGQADGLRNVSLLRATADNQARTEMARVLNAYVTSLAEAAGFDRQTEADRQSLSVLARAALQQARVVDHWYDAPSGLFKTLCYLDMGQFEQVLKSERQIDAPLRQRMLSLTGQVHQRQAIQQGP
ncbi:MAG: hypothetical protein KFF50_12365 [Desulfatitalea sp.]|nr:hypothetical protein [Desulfatitalea sp.]